MKRAFVVLGPESSGTRLMTRLLMAAGCVGDGDHWQRWDELQPEEELIVIRRHRVLPSRVPPWATSDNLVLALQAIGYNVFAVIVTRDWHATACSQIAAPHAPDAHTALASMRNTWRNIFANLPADVPFEVVSYESIVQRPRQTLSMLCQRVGLPPPAGLEAVQDGNEKWYREVRP